MENKELNQQLQNNNNQENANNSEMNLEEYLY